MKQGEELQQVIKIRMAAMNAIRSFFVDRGFVEVACPLLVASPDQDSSLSTFETMLAAMDSKPVALITSPEYSAKKLLGSGVDRLFTLGSVFRNEPVWDATHTSEFTLLEWYTSGADYHQGMEETRELIAVVARALGVTDHPLLHPWMFLRVEESFVKYAEVDRIGERTLEELMRVLQERGLHSSKDDTWSDVFYRLYTEYVEPVLPKDQVTVLYDYPLPQAALARACPDGIYAERFELFSGRLELCNAFTELTDADEQRRRFEAEVAERHRLGKPVFPIDENLLTLLPSVRKPTFGNALGFDRLLMTLLFKKDIREVLPFTPEDLFT